MLFRSTGPEPGGQPEGGKLDPPETRRSDEHPISDRVSPPPPASPKPPKKG